jgi:hypothetical protein
VSCPYETTDKTPILEIKKYIYISHIFVRKWDDKMQSTEW